MKMTVVFSVLCFLILNLFGCGYPMEQLGLYKNGKIAGFDPGNFAHKAIDFEVVKITALNTCLKCHTTGSHSMDTAEKALALKTLILEDIQNGSMPPKSSGYKPLNECEKQILETWLEDQNQSRGPSRKVGELSKCGSLVPEKPKEPTDFANLPLNFENLSKEILAPKCLSCHTEETARKTVLDRYEILAAQRLLAETADASLLYQVTVAGMAKRFMPPKNKGIDELSEAEKDYLRRWIESGAPEL